MPDPDPREAPTARRTVTGLGMLFGAMYFVQGIGEPTEGLIGQPVKSLLAGRGHTAGEIAVFSAVLGLPWAIKPLYGLLTDFIPLFGTRRRSYLLLATAATTFGLFGLYAAFTPQISQTTLLLALLVPSLGIAVTDVVIDALMVERGQQYGMTGRFQSIQWAAIYAAPILAAPIGGYLAAHDAQPLGFLICAVAAACSLGLTILFVRERPQARRTNGFREAVASLRQAAATPGLMLVAGFLFLWNFNPFANTVLYMHLTRGLGLEETFYGWTLSLLSASAVVASIAYGFYCRRVPFGLLLHGSIALGVLSTVGYAAVVGKQSAIAVTLVVGFAYMTAVLIQFDLMARACPPAVAGTAFALLMSVTNISLSLAITLGGYLYAFGTDRWGPQTAFRVVVALGAIFSLSCWFLVPYLRRHFAEGDLAETERAADSRG